jgi:glycyl-tRNA synthetase
MLFRTQKNTDLFFPSSEIYDGLSAVYDYAQNGVELKKTYATIGGKLKKCTKTLGLDAAILMHPTT